ncbi:hypothetical protein BVX93_00025, partial [bacterium B13(2017)]
NPVYADNDQVVNVSYDEETNTLNYQIEGDDTIYSKKLTESEEQQLKEDGYVTNVTLENGNQAQVKFIKSTNYDELMDIVNEMIGEGFIPEDNTGTTSVSFEKTHWEYDEEGYKIETEFDDEVVFKDGSGKEIKRSDYNSNIDWIQALVNAGVDFNQKENRDKLRNAINKAGSSYGKTTNFNIDGETDEIMSSTVSTTIYDVDPSSGERKDLYASLVMDETMSYHDNVYTEIAEVDIIYTGDESNINWGVNGDQNKGTVTVDGHTYTVQKTDDGRIVVTHKDGNEFGIESLTKEERTALLKSGLYEDLFSYSVKVDDNENLDEDYEGEYKTYDELVDALDDYLSEEDVKKALEALYNGGNAGEFDENGIKKSKYTALGSKLVLSESNALTNSWSMKFRKKNADGTFMGASVNGSQVTAEELKELLINGSDVKLSGSFNLGGSTTRTQNGEKRYLDVNGESTDVISESYSIDVMKIINGKAVIDFKINMSESNAILDSLNQTFASIYS